MKRENFLHFLYKVLYPFVDVKYDIDYLKAPQDGKEDFGEQSSEFFRNAGGFISLP